MSSILLSLLEGVWSAEEYNKHSQRPISVKTSENEIKNYIANNHPNLNFEQLSQAIVYEGVSYKEQAITFTRACFKTYRCNQLQAARRNWIKSRLKRHQKLLSLAA